MHLIINLMLSVKLCCTLDDIPCFLFYSQLITVYPLSITKTIDCGILPEGHNRQSTLTFLLLSHLIISDLLYIQVQYMGWPRSLARRNPRFTTAPGILYGGWICVIFTFYSIPELWWLSSSTPVETCRLACSGEVCLSVVCTHIMS